MIDWLIVSEAKRVDGACRRERIRRDTDVEAETEQGKEPSASCTGGALCGTATESNTCPPLEMAVTHITVTLSRDS